MVKFGHWGPNAGPPPIKGRDGSPRRTVVNRTGGGFKYREDVEAMRAELRALREKLDGAEFSISEGASREYAAEARVRQADQQLAQEREAWEAWHSQAAEREAALQARLRETLEAVGTARDAAQSALGSSAETHADLHHRAEECGALQRQLAAVEEGARQARREAAEATGRSSELQREAEALASELEEAHAERDELRSTLARASDQLMRAVDGVQQERSS
jgi:chromosome segregation ATPase